MNASILAERTAKALAAIEAETRRLGGELTITPSRGDAAHRNLLTLEAIAAALGGVGNAAAGSVAEYTPGAVFEVEAVEGVLAVVAESDTGQAAVKKTAVTEAPPAPTGRKPRK